MANGVIAYSSSPKPPWPAVIAHPPFTAGMPDPDGAGPLLEVAEGLLPPEAGPAVLDAALLREVRGRVEGREAVGVIPLVKGPLQEGIDVALPGDPAIVQQLEDATLSLVAAHGVGVLRPVVAILVVRRGGMVHEHRLLIRAQIRGHERARSVQEGQVLGRVDGYPGELLARLGHGVADLEQVADDERDAEPVAEDAAAPEGERDGEARIVHRRPASPRDSPSCRSRADRSTAWSR